MSDIRIEVWLYGALSRYGGEADQGSFARLDVVLPAGSTMRHLLDEIAMPTESRGITFINGKLSALPGVQADLEHSLADGDRVGMFDHRSMWPYQYRHGAAMIEELTAALSLRDDAGLHHTY